MTPFYKLTPAVPPQYGQRQKTMTKCKKNPQ